MGKVIEVNDPFDDQDVEWWVLNENGTPLEVFGTKEAAEKCLDFQMRAPAKWAGAETAEGER